LHHLAAMSFDRDLADAERGGDLFVFPAGDNQRHDLPFARSERPLPLAERAHLRLMLEHHATSFQTLPDGAQQHVVAEGLHQTVDRSAFHGPYGHRYIAVGADEDDRRVEAIGTDLRL
jgi:hypothetical protein